MSEETNIHQEITNKTVGFNFRIVVEREVRVDSGTKYPDKTVTKAELGGHADTYKQARANLVDAWVGINNVLDGEVEVEEPEVDEDKGK